MNPARFSQMMKYLTRAKKEKPDLPDVFPASKAPIPAKTQNVQETEAVNRFMRANPRKDMAGGGMLVQPGFGGTRQGYAEDKKIKGFPNLKVGNRERALVASKAAAEKKVGTSTRFSLPELNRISRIKFGKNFKELPSKKERDRVFSSLVFRQQQKLKGKDVKPVTKKTSRSPFPKDKQTKIKNYFPDADFEKYPRFGYSKDSAEYRRILAFVDRGFKPVFKEIPKSVQELIKDKFTNIKNWDFKRYRYGVPPSESGSQQWQRIRTFVSEPKPNLFAFDYRKPGGWMITQMERAWKHGNPDYDIITVDPNKPPSVDNKIIGVKEKGKAYYANENIAPSNKGKLITSHPEFNKVQKFVDIANEAKLPLKDLTGYKNTKALLKLFPEGYESIKLSELVRFAYDIQGVDVTKNAIEKHHLKTLSDLGAPVDSKNLQLLRRDLNVLANTIGNEVKAGNLSRIPELERAGVKITIDGKTYGKGFQNPTRQLNRIIGDVTQKVSSLDEEQFKTLLQKIGCPGLASGGRAGFDVGTNCQIKGANLINSGMKNATAAQAKNFVAFANRTASLGRGVMKYGVIPEALFVAADSLVRVGMGDNLNEAFLRATNYLTPFDGIKKAEMLEADRFFGPEVAGIIGKSIDYKNQLEKVQSLEDQKENLENLSGGGAFDYVGDTSQDVKNIDAQIKQATDNLNNKFKMTDAERIYAERMQEETDDARSSGSFFTKLKSKFRDVEPDSDIETLGVPEQTQEDLNKRMLPQASTIYKIENDKLIEKNLSEATQTEIMNHVQLLNRYGYKLSTKNLLEQRDYLRGMPLSEQEQIFGKEATYGASGTIGEPINKPVFKKPKNVIGNMEKEIVGQTNVANPFDLDISDIGSGLRGFAAAGGGIAKSAGVSSGPPPASGPNSQGLQGLMKRVRNY
jgi:hypothetical protein